MRRNLWFSGRVWYSAPILAVGSCRNSPRFSRQSYVLSCPVLSSSKTPSGRLGGENRRSNFHAKAGLSCTSTRHGGPTRARAWVRRCGGSGVEVEIRGWSLRRGSKTAVTGQWRHAFPSPVRSRRQTGSLEGAGDDWYVQAAGSSACLPAVQCSHASQVRALFVLMRSSLAASLAARNSSGTVVPLLEYISSGVWPAKAEWGSTVVSRGAA